jgi:type II secretory pathway component GspD/PulD (secretin)
VVVKDGHTVVIGGIIRDDQVKSVSSVPILGDLPILGPLFRSETTRSEKVNLLIFLTPHVISSSQQLQEEARERAKKFRDVDIPAEYKKKMMLEEDDAEKPVDTGDQEQGP